MQTLEAAQELVRSRCKETPRLQWKRLNEYSMVSDCGLFYVSKCSVLGEIKYEVWYKAKGGGSAIQLRMNLPSGDDAKMWASSIANAYRRGQLSLRVPLTPVEIQRLKESTGASSGA